MSLGSWISLSLIGLTWFGLPSAHASVFRISTRLIRPQALQACAWIVIASLLVLLMVLRNEDLSKWRRSWIIALFGAAEVWLLWSIITLSLGWMSTFFDAFVSGLLPATLALVGIRAARKDRRMVSPELWGLALLLLIIQTATLGPMILHAENRLYRSRNYRISKPRISRERKNQTRAESLGRLPW